MERARQVEVFSALASETRLRLLDILDEKELSCEDPDRCSPEELGCNGEELVDQLGITAPSVSNHLKELRRAGLIESEKRGRKVYCYLNRNTMKQLSSYFDQRANVASNR